jgi:hypothetical protein
MDWTRAVDAYCERLDASFWAEPVNALTNVAFLIAALVMARRLRGMSLPLAHALVVILALIGIGSFLFHTVAQAWAGLADMLPILAFILLYLFAGSRAYLGLSPLASLGTVVAFLPAAALLTPLLRTLPVYGVSAGYLPVLLLISLYALLLRARAPATARNLWIGAGFLLASLTARSLDMTLCAALPFGTHFGWHLLNALMLAWMIETYRRHMLAPPPARR